MRIVVGLVAEMPNSHAILVSPVILVKHFSHDTPRLSPGCYLQRGNRTWPTVSVRSGGSLIKENTGLLGMHKLTTVLLILIVPGNPSGIGP